MKKQDVRAFYDHTAAQWAEKWYADETQTPLIEAFAASLPKGARVLDLCCGAGYDSARLNRLGMCTVGIDFSPESIKIARKRNLKTEFHVADMLDSYHHIGMVDAIFCSAGIVHLHREQLRTAFERMAEVLPIGGRALLVVRDGEGRIDRMSDVEVDGVAYDRSFFAHSLEELCRESEGIFSFEREIVYEDSPIWKNYVFRRQ